jgi:transcriptional regulator with XRE-family HTH domain
MSGSSTIPPHAALGLALRKLRREGGLSQEKLGLDSGVQRNFISLIETGQNQPTITTIFKLAAALGIKASELVVAAEAELTAASKARRAAK